MVKARDIKECLEYCKQYHIEPIVVEFDSLTMVQILKGIWKPPVTVAMEVNYINRIRSTLIARVQYSL